MSMTAYTTMHQDQAPLAQGIIVMECLQHDSDLQGHPGVIFSADSGRGIPTAIDLNALQSPITINVRRPGVQDVEVLELLPGQGIMAAISEKIGLSPKNSRALKQALKTKI